MSGKLTILGPKPSSGHSPLAASPRMRIKASSSTLSPGDILGRRLARWGIGRMRFRVEPGLYSVGNPGRESPVLVTANYKMTFDLVRSALAGLDAYVMVLDTGGINVWCAAGKGTFGTAELEKRIALTGLHEIVGHRDLILPQLGAVGVAAHEVEAATGFTVHYGPVDISDIKAYLDAGMEKTPGMARVRFGLRERLAIIPVEIAHAPPMLAAIAAACAALSLPFDAGFGGRFSVRFSTVAGAAAAGIVLFPPLLPYLPFRAFAAKGAVLGTLWSLAAAASFGLSAQIGLPLALAAVPITAFLSMQYTGASTYTNLGGTSVEVRKGLPVMLVAELIGVIGLAVERIMSARAA